MQGGSGVVITIGRKYGSGGKEIGQRLAQRLGIPCHDADLELRGGENEQFAAIRAMAAQGPCVIVGFCADHVLSGTEGLIRVFIH